MDPGLISSSGPMWKHQRRFALATLKYFGVGKKTLENSIQRESQWLCDALQAEKGECGAQCCSPQARSDALSKRS